MLHIEQPPDGPDPARQPGMRCRVLDFLAPQVKGGAAVPFSLWIYCCPFLAGILSAPSGKFTTDYAEAQRSGQVSLFLRRAPGRGHPQTLSSSVLSAVDRTGMFIISHPFVFPPPGAFTPGMPVASVLPVVYRPNIPGRQATLEIQNSAFSIPLKRGIQVEEQRNTLDTPHGL